MGVDQEEAVEEGDTQTERVDMMMLASQVVVGAMEEASEEETGIEISMMGKLKVCDAKKQSKLDGKLKLWLDFCSK